MQPAVPPPPGVLRPVTAKLKPGWVFEGKDRRFRGPRDAVFAPDGLPEGTRIEATVPALAGKAPEKLSAAERDLQRYLQVVLPAGHAPEAFLSPIQRWPCVESAQAGPEVSLPGKGTPRRKG